MIDIVLVDAIKDVETDGYMWEPANNTRCEDNAQITLRPGRITRFNPRRQRAGMRLN